MLADVRSAGATTTRLVRISVNRTDSERDRGASECLDAPRGPRVKQGDIANRFLVSARSTAPPSSAPPCWTLATHLRLSILKPLEPNTLMLVRCAFTWMLSRLRSTSRAEISSGS